MRVYTYITYYAITHVYIDTNMAVDQNPGCRGAPPLLQTLVADLCVEYCSLQGACRGGVCRRTPPSVTNRGREIAAQACYKANVFDSLPYVL